MRQLAPFALSALLFAGCQGDPATPAYWEKQLTNAQKPKDRVKVVEELKASGKMSESFLPMLAKKVESEKAPEVKSAIVKLLSTQKGDAAFDAILAALDLSNTEPAANALNKEIAQALAGSGNKRAVPTLRKLLKAKDPYVRIASIEGLGMLKAAEVVPELSEIATSEGEENFISKKAIIALGEVADPAAVPALTKMMFQERKGVSFYAESSFSLFQVGPKAAEAMLPIMDGKDAELLAWARSKNRAEWALFAKAAQVASDFQDERAEKILLSKLGYENIMLDAKLGVRRFAAQALGRLRSKAAVKPLSAMLDEDEANTRKDYAEALVKIGNADAVGSLVKCAAKGPWDAREACVLAVGALGTPKNAADLQKLVKGEAALTRAECKDNPDYKGCNAPDELVKQHEAFVAAQEKPLAAAGECGTDAGCWEKKLDDADAMVRTRAALELGRSGKASAAAALMKRLREENLEARNGYAQALYWLTDDAAGLAEARKSLADLEKQLADEAGKTQFVKVNEELRRLRVKLKRS